MEVVDGYFHVRRAEERGATGQEWNALGERELLFQRAGVAVARGNSIVLNSLDHSWCVSDSKRKKASSISASESHKNTLAAAKFLAARSHAQRLGAGCEGCAAQRFQLLVVYSQQKTD